jgi:hypothetical protein
VVVFGINPTEVSRLLLANYWKRKRLIDRQSPQNALRCLLIRMGKATHTSLLILTARQPDRGDRPSNEHVLLHALGRYVYRAWVTNLSLTPAGIWYFYDGRAAMEPRIGELREDYALRKIPTRSFEANALYLEIIRLAYNLVTAFQRSCLDPSWQSLMLQKLRLKLFLLPGEITRPQNRPVLRLKNSPLLEKTAHQILAKIDRLTPLRRETPAFTPDSGMSEAGKRNRRSV